jgi:sugar phosphate isomerase/epimerase
VYKLIYFTKFLKGMSVPEIAKKVQALKFDGLDLAVRKGQTVHPENVTQALPDAVRICKDSGLSIPLVTLEGNAIDPASPDIQATYAACGAAGVGLIKLGYWVWQPGEDYWARVTQIKRALEGFAALGKKHNVCSLVHTHSDEYYGSNGAGVMHLVQDYDPQFVGAYLDPAHLSIEGEPLPMVLSMVGKHLRMVAAKNVRYVPSEKPGSPNFKREWCLLNEGLVHWPAALQQFKAAGYNGPISIHGEYSVSEERDEVLKFVAKEMAYIRPLIARL